MVKFSRAMEISVVPVRFLSAMLFRKCPRRYGMLRSFVGPREMSPYRERIAANKEELLSRTLITQIAVRLGFVIPNHTIKA